PFMLASCYRSSKSCPEKRVNVRTPGVRVAKPDPTLARCLRSAGYLTRQFPGDKQGPTTDRNNGAADTPPDSQNCRLTRSLCWKNLRDFPGSRDARKSGGPSCS